MKSIWKWLLGILLALLVLGALVVVAFMWRGRLAGISFREMPSRPGLQSGPMMRGDRFERFDRPWLPFMPAGRGFLPFGGFFSLIGGLARLAIFGALLYGAYWLGRRNARIVMNPRNPPVVESPPSPISDENPPASG